MHTHTHTHTHTHAHTHTHIYIYIYVTIEFSSKTSISISEEIILKPKMYSTWIRNNLLSIKKLNFNLIYLNIKNNTLKISLQYML